MKTHVEICIDDLKRATNDLVEILNLLSENQIYWNNTVSGERQSFQYLQYLVVQTLNSLNELKTLDDLEQINSKLWSCNEKIKSFNFSNGVPSATPGNVTDITQVNLKKDDPTVSSWGQVAIALTCAVRAFFNFFDKIQSKLSGKLMDDTETPGAREWRALLGLESRPHFFPKPILSVMDAKNEWIKAHENLVRVVSIANNNSDDPGYGDTVKL